MTRLRWTLLALALGIALPTFLIVQRAIASLKLENAVRHEAVAERVFDEMERSLSDFLLREESRPASDYAFAPSSGVFGALPGEFVDADDPFIIGWFRLDSGGDSQVLAARLDEGGRIERALQDALGSRAAIARREAPNAVDEDSPAPGRTRSLGTERLEQADLADAREAKGDESSAYEVLQSLNRAQRLRSERQSKALRKDASPDDAESFFGSAVTTIDRAEAELEEESRAAADGGWIDGAAAPSASRPAPSAPFEARGARPLAESAADDALHGLGYVMDGESPAELDDTSKVEGAVRDEGASSSIDPLIGRTTSSGDLVLARSVWRRGSVERQGLVLDRVLLIEWLETRVLAETGLSSRASIDFGAPELPSRADVPHRYLHRFAEPFDALIARLDLDPLTGIGSAQPLYALALLLALVASVGLLAVERMTRVVVDYAQRRSDFVAAVSHELKTPLTSIRMYGEMLRDGLVSSDAKRDEYYTTITDESERLSRLIDNVLEFSRLEQNRRDLSLVVGALPDAIREAAEKLRTHVEREGFALRLDLAEDIPAVQFDRDAVTQLVFNLIDNALKYARHAENREIEIGLSGEDGHVELRVRDFGPGVPEAQLRRVFEPFYRVGEELTRTTQGTGIGLALVKELAEGMGAVVRGCNAKGGGFEVCVAFEAAG